MTFDNLPKHPTKRGYVAVLTEGASKHFREERGEHTCPPGGAWPCVECPNHCNHQGRSNCPTTHVWVKELTAIEIALKGYKVHDDSNL